MRDEPWDAGLSWQCTLCGATYPSEWARDMCQREHDEDDRNAGRR